MTLFEQVREAFDNDDFELAMDLQKDLRFQVVGFSTTGQMKLMFDSQNKTYRICDNRGWYSGKDMDGAEPSLIRRSFPNIERHVNLRVVTFSA
jgi:hypothetical protein